MLLLPTRKCTIYRKYFMAHGKLRSKRHTLLKSFINSFSLFVIVFYIRFYFIGIWVSEFNSKSLLCAFWVVCEFSDKWHDGISVGGIRGKCGFNRRPLTRSRLNVLEFIMLWNEDGVVKCTIEWNIYVFLEIRKENKK